MAWQGTPLTPDAAAELRALRLQVTVLRQALADARAELDKHGYGDFHYNGPGYRDPDVLAALARIDRTLAATDQ